MSTKDLEKATGMSNDNWRRWYKLGLVPPPDRGHWTGRRYSKRLFDEIVSWFRQSVVPFQGRRSTGKKCKYRIVTPFHS